MSPGHRLLACLRRIRGQGLLLALTGLPALPGQVGEAPTTVQPGHWLLEADLVAVASDRHTFWQDGVHYRSTTLGTVLISTGVTARLDVQLGLECWREERVAGDGWREHEHGQGDGWLRCK